VVLKFNPHLVKCQLKFSWCSRPI